MKKKLTTVQTLFFVALTFGNLFGLGGMAVAQAAVFVVDDMVADGDPGSLRDAIEQANAGAGEDTIELQPGRYLLTGGQLEIQQDLSIKGSGKKNTIIDADGNGRVFFITTAFNPDIRVRVEGVTITGGSVVSRSYDDPAYGGGVYNEGDLTIKRSLVNGNTLENVESEIASGGGIFNSGDKAGLTLLKSRVSGNKIYSNIDAYGGGIGSDSANAVILLKGSVVDHNYMESGSCSAGIGGGISSAGDLKIFSSAITANTNYGDNVSGGGIHCNGKLIIKLSLVSKNVVDGGDYAGGGGITAAGDVVLVRSSVTKNKVFGINTLGGGILSIGDNRELFLNRSQISRNELKDGCDALGGGIEVCGNNVKLALVKCKVTDNMVDGAFTFGGGINMRGRNNSVLTLKGTIVTRNSLSGNSPDDEEGGGIRITPNVVYTLSRSAVRSNLPDQIFVGDLW